MFQWLTTSQAGHLLLTLLISAVPVIELRGGIPYGIAQGANPWLVFAASVIGNMLPVPFILLFIEKVLEWMKKTRLFHGFAEWLEKKATGPKAEKIRKVEFLGTLLFVGIPLPGTGAWTGALIVSLLHVDRKKASIAILLGILLAATIMCVITYLIPWIIRQF